jgi:hypothetical protein
LNRTNLTKHLGGIGLSQKSKQFTNGPVVFFFVNNSVIRHELETDGISITTQNVSVVICDIKNISVAICDRKNISGIMYDSKSISVVICDGNNISVIICDTKNISVVIFEHIRGYL